jgi:flagellar motor protein MotB
VGLGKTRLVAPADGTIEEQRINRRVEIVIQDSAQ